MAVQITPALFDIFGSLGFLYIIIFSSYILSQSSCVLPHLKRCGLFWTLGCSQCYHSLKAVVCGNTTTSKKHKLVPKSASIILLLIGVIGFIVDLTIVIKTYF